MLKKETFFKKFLKEGGEQRERPGVKNHCCIHIKLSRPRQTTLLHAMAVPAHGKATHTSSTKTRILELLGISPFPSNFIMNGGRKFKGHIYETKSRIPRLVSTEQFPRNKKFTQNSRLCGC